MLIRWGVQSHPYSCMASCPFKETIYSPFPQLLTATHSTFPWCTSPASFPDSLWVGSPSNMSSSYVKPGSLNLTGHVRALFETSQQPPIAMRYSLNADRVFTMMYQPKTEVGSSQLAQSLSSLTSSGLFTPFALCTTWDVFNLTGWFCLSYLSPQTKIDFGGRIDE